MVLMVFFEYLLVIVFGLIFGSFLTAATFRIPEKISIAKGRSYCPKCKKQIAWYDNIPLLSFILLKGRCRACQQKISLRYPLIELFTAITFVIIFHATLQGLSFKGGAFGFWQNALGVITLPYLLLISVILIAMFVIDLEKQIIPDNLIFFLYYLVALGLILTHLENFYNLLFAGFAAAIFLLSLVFVTGGRGMGLGDVKLAIPLATILGLKTALIWIFLAFLTGGYFGIILILAKKAELRQKIAFGPFLIFAFFIALFWGNRIWLNLGF